MTTETVITLLTWAVPVCFGLHVVEEFIWPGTFRDWYHRYRPQVAGEPLSYYYKANAIYFAIALTVPLMSHVNGLLIWSAVLLYNLVFTHIYGAWKTRSYSPGMVTGIVLYIPLFAFSYSYLLSQGVISVTHAVMGLLLGAIPEVYFSLKKWKAAPVNAPA